MANRLAKDSSPYLLQHAENPVDWYPWGEMALDKARSENRPIFLSIGYSSCYWCHVMACETFEDEAPSLNEHFVSIKVDREERPDLDQVYGRCAGHDRARRLAHVGVSVARRAALLRGTYFPDIPTWHALICNCSRHHRCLE